MVSEEFGIYVHVPFCRRKCLYCDFYSVGERLMDQEKYASAVEREFASKVIPPLPPHTSLSLYIGGGTPSLLRPSILGRFRKMIPYAVGEFTIEVNPDDVDESKARVWRDIGVNRISMGVQSLVDSELRGVGRRHTSENAQRAFHILRKYFDNISLDLMFGLPGQTLDSLSTTLGGFIKMRPEHISAYSLMYEERTALTRLRDAGKIEEADEEDSVEMFRMINSRLREAGYRRYEISNYCLEGRESRHNSNYWRGVPYIGLGPGAHSYDGGRIRSYNAPDIQLYLKAWGEGGEEDKRKKYLSELMSKEMLNDEELREEMILTQLRTSRGLSLKEYEGRFGNEALKTLERKAAPFLRSGFIKKTSDSRLVLSDEGVMISDEVIVGLF